MGTPIADMTADEAKRYEADMWATYREVTKKGNISGYSENLNLVIGLISKVQKRRKDIKNKNLQLLKSRHKLRGGTGK